MECCFKYCSKLKEIGLPNLKTNVLTMSNLFKNCTQLEKIIFGKEFSTNRVNDMSYMFANCISLTELDLSSFVASSCRYFDGMFDNIEKIKVKANKNQDDNLVKYLKECKNVIIVE